VEKFQAQKRVERRLKLNRETLQPLATGELHKVIGGLSLGGGCSCFCEPN
jgi:hypothetical protein